MTIEKDRAYFNGVSYQGTNTLTITFAVSGAKANQSGEETTPTPGAEASATPDATATQTPGAEASATPDATATQTPGTEVSATPDATAAQTPGTEVSATPDATATQTPGAEASATPDAKTTQTPGAEVSPTPIVSNNPGSSAASGLGQGADNKWNSAETTITGLVLTAKVKGVKNLPLKSKYKLAAKKKIKINVSSLPQGTAIQDVTYSSSNPSIVKVNDKGVVMAGKKAGKAVITVTAENGISKKLQIQVMKKAVKKLKLEKKLKTIKKGNRLRLRVKAEPGKKDASNQYYWKSSKQECAVVSEKGIVKARKKGKVKITVYATDGSGKKSSVIIQIK